MMEELIIKPREESKISLQGQHNGLSNAQRQIEILEHPQFEGGPLPGFDAKLEERSQYPLRPTAAEILQINVGKMCNQVCKHCHVDAGPDRKEIMTVETMEYCVRALKINPSLTTIDLTGG
ncbi:MAG: hypothetical protein ABIN04_07645, partial [Ginsengibacter sp.]